MKIQENYLIKPELCDLKLNSKTTSKSLKQNVLEKEKGITLVALVVTIVVLLILAGITISLVFSDNGVIAKANKAKEETQKAQEQEAKDLQGLVDQIDDVFDESELAKLIQSGKIVDTKTTVTDRTGKTITIPAGFKVTSDCQLVDNGVVIEDADGNQFVWVPVDGTTLKYEQHTYNYTGVTNTSDSDAGNNWVDKEGWRTTDYSAYNDWHETAAISDNITSVEANKGFYIGRYEAGLPDAKVADSTYDKSSVKNSDAYVSANKPVSKKGAAAWNFISQTNADTVAGKMYTDTTTYGVKSQLIDSYAWDTVTQWLRNGGYNVTDDSTNWGNYRTSSFNVDGLYAFHGKFGSYNEASKYSEGSYAKQLGDFVETATGIVERNKAKNIYDFAGNIWEWTTEIGRSDGYSVHRGGSFDTDSTYNTASTRHGNHKVDAVASYFGFRVVLYVQ